MSIRDTIEKWVNKTRMDLIANYRRLGLRASGRWERDLESKVKERSTGWRITFLGSKYSQYMISGRRKNIRQDDASIRAFVGWAGSTFLAQWVKQKGLRISPFAVAYKIAREGIKVPNRFNQGTLLPDVFTDERISDLLGEIMGVMVNEIRTDIKTLQYAG
jgi:hypothetical protein